MSFAAELLDLLDTYHVQAEVWDDELEIEIMKQKIEILENPVNKFPPKDYPYFSPSSANSCPRELYMKVKGARRDVSAKQPHQHRWQQMGTRYGDFIQSDLLAIEKHFKKITGKKPAFVPARTNRDYPFWEAFAKEAKLVEYNGHKFYLFGTLDGKLEHKTGAEVGLEIKSKQTTAAQTGDYSMKGPKEDHIKQVTCYSIMYGIDDYIIMYGNLSKKAWVMSEEEYQKYPDLRAFDVKVTDVDRQNVLEYFSFILDCVNNNTPPALDLSKFNFNNYKTACALDLSDDEYEALKRQVKNVLKGNLPDYLKNSYFENFQFIKEVRAK
jgi:hypothetical protein